MSRSGRSTEPASRRRSRPVLWSLGGLTAVVVIGAGAWVGSGHGRASQGQEDGEAGVAASPRALAEVLSTWLPADLPMGPPTRWVGGDAAPRGVLAEGTWGTSGPGSNATVMLGLFRSGTMGQAMDPDQVARLPGHGLFDASCNSSAGDSGVGVQAQQACHQTTLADGDTLITVEHARSVVVLLDSPRRGIAIQGGSAASDQTRMSHLPTTAQWVSLLEQSWWGWALPSDQVDTDAHLASYAETTIGPSAPPSEAPPSGYVLYQR